MGNQEVHQAVPGDHNLFTGTGDIHINYELPPVEASERRVLLQLVNSLKSSWIDAFLKDSLHQAATLELGKELVRDMVQNPWGRVLELPGNVAKPLPQTKSIGEIFSETGRALLILGEPGAGKTVTLIKLARELIARFETNPLEAVPVILNLSTWQDKDTLATWIEAELKSKYFVPLRRSRVWLESSRLILLLDGLDEVPAGSRLSCVRAINEFAPNLGLPGIVVCSRRTEYIALPERLNFRGAVCLQPLTVEQVDDYLNKFETQLAPLRQAIKQDKDLAELARTPLMLNVMSLAFQGAAGDELARQKADSPEERRKQIFRLYVEQMFQRKGTTSLVFPKEKIIGWLSWLAGKMREHSQSVFLVEGLQPSWLGTRAGKLAYGTVVALSVALIGGLIFGLSAGLSEGPSVGLSEGIVILVGVGLGCWSQSPLKNGVMSGSLGALIVGLIVGLGDPKFGSAKIFTLVLLFGLSVGLIGGLGAGSLNHINLVETISWKWNQFWKRTIPGSIVGLIFGLISGLSDGLLGRGRLSVGLRLGLIFGLSFGLATGLVGGFTDRVKVGKASPNQGIKLSRKNSLAACLVTLLAVGLTSGLTCGLILGLIFGPTWLSFELRAGLSFGLPCGLIAGLIVGLNRGGSAVIKHYALRLMLWLKGYTPFKFIKFLDQCARLILLKKVGGSYIFIHRMLLEYFADMPAVHKI